MTRMLPTTIHSSVRSGAERKLFGIIRDAPATQDWVCVHSLGLARHGHKRRGEIDFALVMPEGVLVLEAKGGRVERRDGHWIFTDRFGNQFTKGESPFDQAASAMFALEAELREHFGRGSRIGNVLLGYGVLFPDVEFRTLGVEAQRAQVYDKRDADKPFARWVRELISWTRTTQSVPRNGLDKNERDSLVEYLRGDFELVPGFDVTSSDVNRGLNRLTRQQAACLAGFDSMPRLIVEGSAGTGKSMIAVETARREAAAGRSVIVLCFNRLLAGKLRRTPGGTTEHLRVLHAHEFMRTVIAGSAVASDFEAAVAREKDKRRIYDSIHPEFASLALAGGAFAPCDTLIVDEAQDLLTPPFLEMLDFVVRDGLERGRWRIFLDTNEQAALYGKLDTRALERLRGFAPTTLLPMNCRNTVQIDFATRVVAQPRVVVPAFHSGEHVERRWYDTEKHLAGELRSVFRELHDRGAPPGSISVIYPTTSPELEKVLSAVGARALTPELAATLGTSGLGCITHSTVSAFKGLENDVVVLAGVEQVESDWWRAVAYVGMSRPRVKLYVLLNARLRPLVERRFEAITREALAETAEGIS